MDPTTNSITPSAAPVNPTGSNPVTPPASAQPSGLDPASLTQVNPVPTAAPAAASTTTPVAPTPVEPAATPTVDPAGIVATNPAAATSVQPVAPVAGPNDLKPDELTKMVEGLSPEQVQQLQQQVQKLASGDLSKYKMRFKGTTYDQLMQLVKSSTLLEPEDHPKFEAKYKDMQNVAELEKAFNVLFEEEHEYLTEEIAEMDKLLAGKLQGDQNTINLQTAYKARLVALQTLEQTLTGTQPLPPA